MKKIGILVFLITLLSGCGTKEQTTICTSTTANKMQNSDISITYDKEEDVAHTMIYKTTIKITDDGYDKSALVLFGENYDKTIANTKGVTFSYEISDNEYRDTITINFDKADLDELIKLKIIQPTYKKDNTVSYKRVIEDLKAVAFTCKEE
jgi:uncharacterized lipoprotein YehR (DUF1307 family)